MRFDHLGRMAIAALVVMTGSASNAVLARAAPPPLPDPAIVPADGPPGPQQTMRQSTRCAHPVVIAEPNVSELAPGLGILNIRDAWQYSTGNGVAVAVIDTGISPNTRLPVLPGGDYIMGGDGLTDCDAHGTIVASLIAAAPQGFPPPTPMPVRRAFPAPSVAASTPAAPAAEPAVPDGVVGVAPHATLISIRQTSRAFAPQNPQHGDPATAGTLATLARAVVHAANLGAKVINVGVTECLSTAETLDQREIAAAVWYAATVKDVVIVTAAGNEGEDGCVQNPAALDPPGLASRGWHQLATISSPSWFADYVLAVGAVDIAGAPIAKSLAGPWVGVAAPGMGITGLSPQGGAAVNAYPPMRPGEAAVPFWGTSFSAAYVSGVAALVRAKYPNLTAREVIRRIQQTAHSPARGVDNRVGHGVVDPVAALTFDVGAGEGLPPHPRTRALSRPTPPPPADQRALRVAVTFAVAAAVCALLAGAIGRARRAR